MNVQTGKWLAVLLAGLNSLLLCQADMTVARQGTAKCVIIHDGPEKAAEELRDYLNKITGAEFKILPEKEFDGKSAAIFVGNTRFAKKKGIDFATFQPEEWFYQSKDNHLILGGHPHNGIDFAVYEFLEKELGCHWFTFESEFIPKQTDLILREKTRRGKPAFTGRAIYMPPWDQAATPENTAKIWSNIRKNRGNLYHSPQIESKQYGNCHSFYEFVPPSRYFKTHPEYFSMNRDGKRFHGSEKGKSGGQLCLSNPEMAEAAYRQLKEFIRKDRSSLPKEKWPNLYDISQLDDTHFLCLCPECRKITEAEGSDSGLVLTFLNRIAEKIAGEYPDITLRTMAYVSSEKAPKTMRPEKNVQIQWCDLYTRSDCYRPLESRFNAVQKANLEGWKAKGARLAVWDYWNMGIADGPYFKPPRVETMIDAIPSDIRYFRKCGVETFFTEAETQIHRNPQNFYDLQNWLGYQLLNQPDQDEEKLIAAFLKHHYGPASAAMTEFLTLLRNAVRSEKKPLYYIFNPVREYQTGEFLRQAYDLLQKAKMQTSPGTPYRLRVEKELITPIAVILHHPQLQTGLEKESLLKEYEELRNRQITAYCDPGKQASLKKELAEDLAKFRLEIPTPEQFRHLPAERIQKFAYPVFSNVENDPDSVLGKAMASLKKERDTMRHEMKPQAGGLYPTWFGVYDWDSKKGIQLRLNDIPQDEKYHWYKIGSFDFGKKTKLWGWFWWITADLGSVWTNADGLPGFNTWEVWVSVKITGPAYVKGSQKENRVFADQVILVKP